MSNVIKFYKSNEPQGFLNNFYPCRFFLYDHWWNHVEGAFQYAKTFVPSEQEQIVKAASPRDAKNLGQKVSLRKDWEFVKLSVMRECVLAKFTQNHELREKLLETGGAFLIENSPIDYYWGCGSTGTGLNKLGETLMNVRSLLKE